MAKETCAGWFVSSDGSCFPGVGWGAQGRPWAIAANMQALAALRLGKASQGWRQSSPGAPGKPFPTPYLFPCTCRWTPTGWAAPVPRQHLHPGSSDPLLGQTLLLPASSKPGPRGAAAPSAHLWASFFYIHF